MDVIAKTKPAFHAAGASVCLALLVLLASGCAVGDPGSDPRSTAPSVAQAVLSPPVAPRFAADTLVQPFNVRTGVFEVVRFDELEAGDEFLANDARDRVDGERVGAAEHHGRVAGPAVRHGRQPRRAARSSWGAAAWPPWPPPSSPWPHALRPPSG